MGVRFAGVGESDAVVAIARNTEVNGSDAVSDQVIEDVTGVTAVEDAGTADTPTGAAVEGVHTGDADSTDADHRATVEASVDTDDAGQEDT
jgi:DNA gyrase subunit A